MKIRSGFTFFLITAFIVAGGVLYWWAQEKSNRELSQESLIPQDAVFVYESNSPYKVANQIGNSPIWKTLLTNPFFRDIEDKLSYIDTLDHLRERVIKYFQETPLTLSLHVVAKNEFDFIFYLPLKHKQDVKLFAEVINDLEAKKGVKIKTRSFENLEIMDIFFGDEGSFSLLKIENFLVGSSTGFLVEDVIRTERDSENISLFKQHKSYFDLAKIKGDQGDLFFNTSQFPFFLSAIFNPASNFPLSEASHFSPPIFADIRWQGDEINFSGATLDHLDESYFLNLFQGESPKELSLAKFAPNNTAAFYEYGFQDGLVFLEQFRKYLKSNGQDSLLENWYNIGQEKGIYLEPFFNYLDGGISLAVLEKHISGEQPILFMASVNDRSEMEDYLKKINNKIIQDTAEIINERYGNFTIQEIPIEEFPSKLLGGFFRGFNRSFYIFHKDNLVISNRLAGLRSFIHSIEMENNWGKSVKMNLFFEKAVNPANFTAIFNLPRLYKSILPEMQPYWAKIFQENEREFKKFELISAQWKFLDDRFFANVSLQHNGFSLDESEFKEPDRLFKASLPLQVLGKPKMVKNHKDKSLEALLQLEDKSLSLISRTGRILWNVDLLDGGIICEPYQIDYFKNDKLQYLLATSKRIYLIDRLGRMVEGFPIKVYGEGNNEIDFLQVLDYNRTRDYRFLVANSRGKILLMNPQGKKLEGWKPKDLGKGLASMPFHTRINGKDILVFLTKNGKLHAFRRNGNEYPGFPLNFDLPFSNPVFQVQGPDLSSSKMFLLSDDGTFIKVSFSGNIISKNQLIRESPDSEFSLIISRQGEDFVISRYENGIISLISPEFDLMFQLKLLVSTAPKIQFYDFEGNYEVFGILERAISKMRIFSKGGKEYSWSPLTADKEISILFYEDQNELRIFKSNKNEFSSIIIRPE